MKKKTNKLLLWLLTLIVAIMSISITTLAADEIEPNDGSNTATVIATDELHKGSLNSSKDIDWYKFTNSQDYFTLEFSLDSSVNYNEIGDGWIVNVYDNVGNSIKSYRGITTYLITPVLSFEGDYLIEVKADYTGNAPIDCVYNLKINTVTDANWETENNETSSSANSITVNAVHKGSFYKSGDVDWYKFTNSQDYFTLDFSMDSTVDYNKIGSGWSVNIYGSDGNSIIKSYSDVTSDFTTPILPFKGDFFIRVIPDYTGNAPVDCVYNIKVNTKIDSSWESEFNDESKSADSIATGKDYYGALYKSTDIDWYVAETKTGAFNVSLTLDDSVSYDDIGDGWKITVYPYGSTKAIVTYYDVLGKLTSFDIPYKGKIAIKVQADYTGNAPVDCVYKLKVTQHKAEELWEAEKNDEKDAATNLTSGKTYNANLDCGSDVDFFKYQVPSTGIINFAFSRAVSDAIRDGYKIYILNKDGDTLYSATDVTVASLNKNGINVNKGETVYVKVCADYTGNAPSFINYSIAISNHDHTYSNNCDDTCNTCNSARKTTHTYKTTTTKATLKKNGKQVTNCTVCGEVKSSKTIYYPKSIKLSATSYTYNGKAQKPSVTVKDSKGNKLKNDTDYTVKYESGRKTPGKYTVTVTFKGKYSGTKKLTFTIKPKAVTLSKLTAGSKQLTVTWKTVTAVTGYEVQYSTSSKFSSKTTKKTTVKSSKTKKLTIKKLKKGKKYYVKVRAYKTVDGKKIYGAWSSVKSVKVK